MKLEDYNAYCGGLTATTHVVQWGGAHVWKVGGKVFAIAGWNDGAILAITFKVSDIAFEVLSHQDGLRPAPYLASRGFNWIQHYAAPGLTDDGLREHIAASHALVAKGLSRKKRIELGLVASDT